MTAHDLTAAISNALVARLHRLRLRRAASAGSAFRLEDAGRLHDADGRCHAYARCERAVYALLNEHPELSDSEELAA